MVNCDNVGNSDDDDSNVDYDDDDDYDDDGDDSFVTQAWLAETQGWDDNDNVSSSREQTLR